MCFLTATSSASVSFCTFPTKCTNFLDSESSFSENCWLSLSFSLSNFLINCSFSDLISAFTFCRLFNFASTLDYISLVIRGVVVNWVAESLAISVVQWIVTQLDEIFRASSREPKGNRWEPLPHPDYLNPVYILINPLQNCPPMSSWLTQKVSSVHVYAPKFCILCVSFETNPEVVVSKFIKFAPF